MKARIVLALKATPALALGLLLAGPAAADAAASPTPLAAGWLATPAKPGPVTTSESRRAGPVTTSESRRAGTRLFGIDLFAVGGSLVDERAARQYGYATSWSRGPHEAGGGTIGLGWGLRF